MNADQGRSGDVTDEGFTVRSRSATGVLQIARAHAALFLLTPDAAWTTGAVLSVDGGYTAQ